MNHKLKIAQNVSCYMRGNNQIKSLVQKNTLRYNYVEIFSSRFIFIYNFP